MPRKPGEIFRNKKRKYDRKYDQVYEKKRGTPAQRGYDRRWRKVRKHKLRMDPLCEVCLREGYVVPATEVHHIVPISEGGEVYAYENLMSVCHSCHMKIHQEIEQNKGVGGTKSL